MKLLTREITQTILPKAKEMIENDENSEKSHDEICALVLQRMFVSSFRLIDKAGCSLLQYASILPIQSLLYSIWPCQEDNTVKRCEVTGPKDLGDDARCQRYGREP